MNAPDQLDQGRLDESDAGTTLMPTTGYQSSVNLLDILIMQL